MDESIHGFGASPWPVFMTVVHVRTGQAGHCTVLCRGWAAAEAHNLTLHNSGSHGAHLAPATASAWGTATARTRGARPTCPASSSARPDTPARRRRATSPSRPPTSPPTSGGWTSCRTPSMTSTSAPTPATPGTGEWQTVQDGGRGTLDPAALLRG